MSFWRRPPWQPRTRVGLEHVELSPDPMTPYLPAIVAVPPGRGWIERVTRGTGTTLWTYAATDADDALAIWQEWRAVHDSTGWWPLLVDWDFWSSVDRLGLTATGSAATGSDWLTGRLYGGSEPLADRIPRGLVHWSTAGASPRLRNYLGATDVVLVPAAAGWLVPEVLGWTGGERLEVYGPQHTLVLRRWAGQWGAEPLGMSSDELVLRITRPPKSRAEAWLAAVELAAYCPELVRADQDSALEDLAGIMRSGHWEIFFDLDDDTEDDDDSEGDDDSGEGGRRLSY